MLFERFTERARQVIVLAQEEARHFKSDHIGQEHILCGLFREEEGLAAKILRDNLHLSYNDARDLIVQGDEGLSGQIPFTPNAKKALELALREALSLGHNYIGTEHILLGLVRDPNQEIDAFFSLAHRLDPNHWQEAVKLEVIEMLRGPTKRKVPEDLTPEENEDVETKEVVADLLTGFSLWREIKGDDDLDDADEMLIRWISASKARDIL